jgi:pimeloyl-ACP methyl ester carboxylesterase
MATEPPARPLLVVLPGLDGTGRRLQAFAALIAKELDCRILTYPSDRPAGYAELETLLRPELPTDRPYALLGESFGGPLALRLAATATPPPRALVLVNTCVRSPYPWLPGLARWAALAPLKSMPRWLRARLLWDGTAAGAVPRQSERATATVPRPILRGRLRSFLAEDARASLQRLCIPVLALRGSRDRLLPPRASRQLSMLAPRGQYAELAGPHLLLQACPDAAAARILAFIRQKTDLALAGEGAECRD